MRPLGRSMLLQNIWSFSAILSWQMAGTDDGDALSATRAGHFARCCILLSKYAETDEYQELRCADSNG